MFKAVVLGISISCIMLGIQCLAVEQVRIEHAGPTITSTAVNPATDRAMELTDIQISPLWAWLLIGIGTSTTFYTLFNRSSSDETRPCSLTATSSDLSDQSQFSSSLTEEDEASWDDDQYETDDFDDSFEQHDEADQEFDFERFQQEFDIDSLLDESA